MHHATEAAEAARTRWGASTAVLVAAQPLEPGDPLTSADVVLTELPMAMVPATALTRLPADATVTRPPVAGEVVLEGHLGRGGVVPTGSRGLAVPITGSVPDVRAGVAVDLVAWADPVLGGDGRASTVAGGVVVSVGDQSITVAVPAAQVDAAVAALATGTIVVVTR